jgi:hypothetical protein
MSDYFMSLQANPKGMIDSTVKTLNQTIALNLEEQRIKIKKGTRANMENAYILVARIAGIYNYFGGNVSHGKDSIFVNLIASVLSELGIYRIITTFVENTKKKNFYQHYLESPVPPDFYKKT